jgi:hypothetical protein
MLTYFKKGIKCGLALEYINFFFFVNQSLTSTRVIS